MSAAGTKRTISWRFDMSASLKAAQRGRLQDELLSPVSACIGTHGLLARFGIHFGFRFFPFLEHGYTHEINLVTYVRKSLGFFP